MAVVQMSPQTQSILFLCKSSEERVLLSSSKGVIRWKCSLRAKLSTPMMIFYSACTDRHRHCLSMIAGGLIPQSVRLQIKKIKNGALCSGTSSSRGLPASEQSGAQLGVDELFEASKLPVRGMRDQVAKNRRSSGECSWG